MKILAYIVTTPKYSASGAVNAALELSYHLRTKCDIDVFILGDKNLDYNYKGKLIVKQIKSELYLSLFRFLPLKLQNLFKGVSNFRNIVKSKYDLVHIHNPVPPLELLRTVIYFRSRKIPIFITSHGFVEVLNFRHSYNLPLIFTPFIYIFVTLPFKYALKYVDKVFVFSNYEIGLLRKHNIPINSAIIPNGHTIYDNLIYSDDDYEKTVNKYKIKKDENVIFFLGNHTPNKGIDDVINCVKYFDSICVIIGGKIKDNYYLDLASKVSDVNKRIIFTDFISDDEVRVLYKICDIFLFPTKADTFPLVILDAMYNKCTIVTTEIGGIPYQLDNDSGVILTNYSPKIIYETINNLLCNSHQCAFLSKNAKLRVTNCFTWKIAAQKAYTEYKLYFNDKH